MKCGLPKEGHLHDADPPQLDLAGKRWRRRGDQEALLVGRDPDNDLAVVQVDPNGTYENSRSVGELLRPAALGDSDQVVIGENAVAIGSPLGLQQTVTAGMLLDRIWPDAARARK